MSERAAATFSGLLDAEERHRIDPMSFSIPRSELRRALRPGSIVKLLFGFGAGDPPPAERMWVEVLSVDGDQYVGRLDNEPSAISDLKLDDHVRFGPEHVAAVWRELPHAPRPEQFAVVSTRVWRDGAWPARLVRMPPPDDQFSGWFLFADGDPLVPPKVTGGEKASTNARSTGPIAISDLVDSMRSEARGEAFARAAVLMWIGARYRTGTRLWYCFEYCQRARSSRLIETPAFAASDRQVVTYAHQSGKP